MTHPWWFPATIVLVDVLLNISEVRCAQINVQESSIHLIPEAFVFVTSPLQMMHENEHEIQWKQNRLTVHKIEEEWVFAITSAFKKK